MKTIVVASHNPVKQQAALDGFQRMFPGQAFDIQAIEVPSGVSDQPVSDDETLQGALNRARQARRLLPQADFWVGIEGGVQLASANPDQLASGSDEMAVFAWVVVVSVTKLGKARTGAFFLPPVVMRLVKEGSELGEADDIVFGRTNSKQKNGAVGLLTGDVIDRRLYYEQAVVLALIPFRNPDLY